MKRTQEKTIQFAAVIGVNEGYFHNNDKDANVDFNALYQQMAVDMYDELGVYISASISEKKVVYHKDCGCPVGGETVYSIIGTCNPEFCGTAGYKQAAMILLEKIAHKLNQTTFTVVWQDVELNYISFN